MGPVLPAALLGAVMALGAGIGSPALLTVRAWTLVATPLTLTAGVSTAVDLTATNTGTGGEGEAIGCVTVLIPGTFDVSGAKVVSLPSGYSWRADVGGASGSSTLVRFRSESGSLLGDLLLEQAILRITTTAATAGAYTWEGRAYTDPSCGSGAFPMIPVALTVLPPLTPVPTPTPSPRPTPTPAPTITPAPTAAPTPSGGPSSTPSASGPPSPTPATSLPPSSPAGPGTGPTASPSASSTPASGPGGASGEPGGPTGVAGMPGAGGTTGPADAQGRLRFRVGPVDGTGLDLGSVASGSGLGFTWVVPGLVLAVPGLLLVLAVFAQAVAGLVWLPVIRRRIGAFGLPRRGPKPG